ncbi:MAG TPA: hypothetical protein PKX40_01055 [Spirochaetota bacterium]|nr:hypothetical protein [Spirochaetota bacterium]
MNRIRSSATGGNVMYEMNEIMALAFGCIGLVILVFFLRKRFVPRFTFLLAAYCCVLASNFFTVAEGFFLHDVFNLLEHTAYLASGVFVLAGIIRYRRKPS